MATLLIIDDSVTNRREIIRILVESGEFSSFLEAGDGVAGLKVLNEEAANIDVVVCDTIMPRMDGYEFLRAAKASPALFHIPVVMVTEQTKLKDVVKAFELGASDFINRPFIPPLLSARLKNMLRIKQLQDQLKLQKDIMEKLATTDPLTGIPNVRYFRERLEDEQSRALRYRTPLALFMIDLDHFKSINDKYGHPKGDTVLQEVAKVLKATLRKVDLLARYGGEEFVVAMPHTTRAGAGQAAERLRERVQDHPLPGFPETLKVTISLGVAHFAGERELKVQQLIDAADQALYEAKKNGRNRVELSWLPEAQR